MCSVGICVPPLSQVLPEGRNCVQVSIVSETFVFQLPLYSNLPTYGGLEGREGKKREKRKKRGRNEGKEGRREEVREGGRKEK